MRGEGYGGKIHDLFSGLHQISVKKTPLTNCYIRIECQKHNPNLRNLRKLLFSEETAVGT